MCVILNRVKKFSSNFFYRLPQDLFQTAKVVKLLLLLIKGKGTQFKGKSLKELDQLGEDILSNDDEESNPDEPDELDELTKWRTHFK